MSSALCFPRSKVLTLVFSRGGRKEGKQDTLTTDYKGRKRREGGFGVFSCIKDNPAVPVLCKRDSVLV